MTAHLHVPNRQLLLDLKLDTPRSFKNFVIGGNQELLGHLCQLPGPHRHHLYLWGPPGSGRSHLLQAVAAQAVERGVLALPGRDVGAYLAPGPGQLLIVDDVEQLNAEAQIALFRAFNSARLEGWTLLLSGTQPPLTLPLREDLRTRIGQCLIYEVKPLSDAEKAEVLAGHAAARGMRLDESVVQWLLRHGRRDLPSLLAAVDALDQASLTQKRPATLPLLREVINAASGT